MEWFKMKKDDYQEIKSWEFDLELVDYGGNNNLKTLLNEINILNKKWKLTDFLSWILLYWPPWTGKTLFWKYLAKELQLPFFYVSSNNLKSSYYWWTWEKIKNFFNWIRKKVKKWNYNWAVVFIDELDSIWKSRKSWDNFVDEWLNTLLTEIDWIKDNNFIVIGSTNLLENLDEAILSRFNNKILVKNPNKEEREEIILNQLIFKLIKMV